VDSTRLLRANLLLYKLIQTSIELVVTLRSEAHNGAAVLAADVVQALDELVMEGFLIGPVAVPREGNRGPSTSTVYVLKELYSFLYDIWERNGVHPSTPSGGAE
jgi:hypothetical protein